MKMNSNKYQWIVYDNFIKIHLDRVALESTSYNKIDKYDEQIMQITQDLKQISRFAIVIGGLHRDWT
jgi:hypothetical protein